jgi:hypothetical protein
MLGGYSMSKLSHKWPGLMGPIQHPAMTRIMIWILLHIHHAENIGDGKDSLRRYI